jgi:3-oxoacyl-[acyl-carrier protein] reductase
VSVALVTGGARGIGRAIVEELAGADYRVAFTYATRKEAADALVGSLGASGKPVTAIQADVRNYSRAREVVDTVTETLGPVTVLVNNAGIRKDGVFHAMDPGAWQEVIETNLTGAFNYSRLLAGDMIRRGGSIINITSVGGILGMAGQANYCASKAGLIGFTKALSKEIARFGVRVNAIAPGYIDTEMTESIDPEVRKKLYSQIPMRRTGAAQEIAKLVLYLASDAAAYVTGQVWAVDGGLS